MLRECLAGLCRLLPQRCNPGFFLRGSLKRYDLFKRACFHAAEAEAAGCRHLIVLIADINIKWARFLSLAYLALLAF